MYTDSIFLRMLYGSADTPMSDQCLNNIQDDFTTRHDVFSISLSNELFGIRLRLPVLLATKFLHLRSTTYKSRTCDPVPTLKMRPRTSNAYNFCLS